MCHLEKFRSSGINIVSTAPAFSATVLGGNSLLVEKKSTVLILWEAGNSYLALHRPGTHINNDQAYVQISTHAPVFN